MTSICRTLVEPWGDIRLNGRKREKMGKGGRKRGKGNESKQGTGSKGYIISIKWTCSIMYGCRVIGRFENSSRFIFVDPYTGTTLPKFPPEMRATFHSVLNFYRLHGTATNAYPATISCWIVAFFITFPIWPTLTSLPGPNTANSAYRYNCVFSVCITRHKSPYCMNGCLLITSCSKIYFSLKLLSV